MKTINRDFITLKKASEIVGCTPEHLNLMVRRKKLEGKKMGRNWYTTSEWLDKYLKEKSKGKKNTNTLQRFYTELF